MPIYDYDCPDCGQTFEKRVSISQADAVVCPECGGSRPQRKLSRIAIQGLSTASSGITMPAPGGG